MKGAYKWRSVEQILKPPGVKEKSFQKIRGAVCTAIVLYGTDMMFTGCLCFMLLVQDQQNVDINAWNAGSVLCST